MNKILIVLASSLFVLGATFGPVKIDYRLITGPSTFTIAPCTAGGPMCDNCTHVSNCVDLGDGTFEKFPVKKCEAGTTCLNGDCVTTTNPVCDPVYTYPFPCHDSGLFPDPLDCHKYHFCVPKADLTFLQYDAQCDAGYGYNAGTTFCDRALVADKCSSDPTVFPVPVCQAYGQIGPLLENNRIYYICADYSTTKPELYPHLFTCKHGSYFEGNGCVNGTFLIE